MATRTPVSEKGIYFITFTCYDWKPLIRISNTYQDVYKFFDVLNAKGSKVLGYVIMPNHLHLLLYHSNEEHTLNTLIGNGKRFLAYAIIKSLEQKDDQQLLERLSRAVPPLDKKRGKKHEIWKAGFDVKCCRTEKFLLQKLHYIHDNPVRGKWHLAKDNESYEHSSCLFYFRRTQRHCVVTHYEEVLDCEYMYE